MDILRYITSNTSLSTSEKASARRLALSEITFETFRVMEEEIRKLEVELSLSQQREMALRLENEKLKAAADPKTRAALKEYYREVKM